MGREFASGVAKEVFAADVKAVKETTQAFLELPSLAVKLKEPGASYIKAAATAFPKFEESVDKVSRIFS